MSNIYDKIYKNKRLNINKNNIQEVRKIKKSKILKITIFFIIIIASIIAINKIQKYNNSKLQLKETELETAKKISERSNSETIEEDPLKAKEGQYVYTINDTYLIHREGCYDNIDTNLEKTHKYKPYTNLGSKASTNDKSVLAAKSKLIFMSNSNALYGKLTLSAHTAISENITELGNETTQWARVRVDVAGTGKKETDIGYSWKTGLLDNSNLIFVYTVEQKTNLYTYDSSTNTYKIDSTKIINPGDEYRINKLENDYIKIEKIENGNLTGIRGYISREKLVRKMSDWNDEIPTEYQFTKSSNAINNMIAIAYYVRTLHPQYALYTPMSYIDGILSFNCSGFVQFAMKYAGIDIEKVGSAQDLYDSLNDGEIWERKTTLTYGGQNLEMPLKTTQNNKNIYQTVGNTVLNNLQKGDILYFKTSMGYSDVTHMGIYVGNGTFIHSCGDSGVICTNLIDWLNGGEDRDIMGYSRYKNPNLGYEKDFSDIQKYSTYSDITIDARIMYDESVQNKFIRVKAKKDSDKIDYSKSKAIINDNDAKIGEDSDIWNDNYESFNMADQTFYFNEKKDLNLHYLHLLLYKNDNSKEEIVVGPIIFEVDKNLKNENTNTYETGEIIAIMQNTTITDNDTKTQTKNTSNKLMKYLTSIENNKVLVKDLNTNKKYLVAKNDIKNVYQCKNNKTNLRSTPEAPSDNSNMVAELNANEIIVELLNNQNAYFDKDYVIKGDNAGKIGYLSNSINKTKIITEIETEGISVKTAPNKTTYIKGENLDLTNGVITVQYENGEKEDVSMTDSNVQISGYDKTKTGTQQITVKYNGKTTTFNVTVKNNIAGISVKTTPNKTTYVKGENLDLTNGVITVQYENGEKEDVPMSDSNVQITGYDKTKTGTQQITVKYNGQTTIFEVKVKDEITTNEITRIEINTLPKKTIYKNGEELELTEGIITLIYENGETVDIPMTDSNVQVTGYDKNKTGTQQITVTYNGKTTTFDIVVEEDPKDDTKDDTKDDPKDDPKDDTKDDTKDDPKDDNKNDNKDDNKEENNKTEEKGNEISNNEETKTENQSKKYDTTDKTISDKKIPFVGTKIKSIIILFVLGTNGIIATIKLKKYKDI